MFDILDMDGSGVLEEGEGKIFLRSTGCVPDQLDYYWKDLLRTADTDGDGSISKSEFSSYILVDESLTDDGLFEDKERETELRAQIKCLARMDITAHKKINVMQDANLAANKKATAATAAVQVNEQKIQQIDGAPQPALHVYRRTVGRPIPLYYYKNYY